ncbi:MAG TPA: hypothetical protein DGF30_13060 [Desulfomicrobium sp.]|nr:hypothetical protein [Desulfomicrobium sp.]
MKDATQKTETPSLPLPESLTKDVLLRLPQVLMVVNIPKSSWWRGVKEGRFPKPIKLGPRTSAWRASDLESLIDRLAAERRA